MSNKAKATYMKEDGQPALVPRLRFPEFRDAAAWQIKPFAKLFSIGNGRDHKHLAEGSIPVYGSGGYMRSVDEYLYDGESVCIGRKGTISNPMFLSGKFWTVDTLFYTHSFNQCLPRFIFSIFQSIDWLKHNEAGGVPSLSKTNIEKIETAIPTPAEQQKIAECLSSLDELIAALARKVDALKTHKKGLMQQLFPREGETQPRLRFPEFQDTGKWNKSKLGQLATYTKGFAFKSQDYVNEGVRIIRVSDLGMNFIKLENEKIYIHSGLTNEYEKYEIKKFEIIITTVGSKPEMVDSAVGRGIFVSSSDQWLLNQNLLKLEVTKEINSEFLFSHINTVRYQKFIASISRGNANQANIAVKDLMDFELQVPSPNEQKRIADCLTSLDNLITAATQELETLKTHKKGLMQQLFPSAEAVEA